MSNSGVSRPLNEAMSFTVILRPALGAALSVELRPSVRPYHASVFFETAKP